MKVNFNLEKKYVYSIVGLLILIAGIFIVNAYGGTQPSVMGHSADEVEGSGGIFTDAGSYMYYNEKPVAIGQSNLPRYGATFESAGKAMFAVLGIRTDPADHGNYVLAACGGEGAYLCALDVSGSKNFKIDHPLDPDNKWLYHSTLEGPEIGVYYRGEAQLKNGQAIIELPDYFEALTSEKDRTALLTCLDDWSPLYIKGDIVNGKFTVKTTSEGNQNQKFYWEVKAVRKDIPPLVVEKDK